MSESPEKPSTGYTARVSTGTADVGDPANDLFFAAVETTRMPMIVTDPRQPDNPIIFANRAFMAMTGYATEELLGRNCRFLQGPRTDRGTIEEIRSAVAARRNFSGEVLNYRKDGSSFWNALYISPIHNAAGELVYFFGSQLDVSRRREAEEGLSQAQKMEALGQLTGGIAHDFNNLLQVIVGYVEILASGLQKPEPDRARLGRATDNIRIAAERATTLTQQLLSFARKQRLEGRPVNLNTLISGMDGLLRRSLGEAVFVEQAPATDLWTCQIDPTQAEVAILNVVINARDAMPDGGTITVRTENREMAGDDITGRGPLNPGPYVVLSVTDTGTGMSPDVLARVLDPFFTTKEEGKGTGLGLSMVYGFAKQSGGAVDIVSKVGEGTTVRLFFPAIAGSVDPVETGPLPERAEGGDETVLVVDDRQDVAELARSILRDHGYRTLTAGNAREALDILDGSEPVDLLFSDLIMPGGMNGLMLAREARKRQPGLRILLTTGYAGDSLERTDMGAPEFEILKKPYRRADLSRRVRDILDAPAP
ncbi:MULTISPECIES: histidine kinase famiy protein [Methylobacterium]|uniref:histidine kinase n=3 Tax=Pseudomonadota TaxID=1224 RepID=A0ABQ4T483_9HYPH|nr:MULTISPECIES: histidine kinase famiy protein [Methylobacterium]PIU04333.1 MAG: hybrid sensor histidine kinase/response regulator [Methylobacterium sp. CG09_land_8_20_14_0_10_71_15]PIU12455.1 MAG: hybrid sensor histidine kinase/response regulator [Methylobacterium sp. CG08_land_8_20_14_0_20_71_15]GBU19595.1 hybrid sensor histidine kinase/response regulator [Methylobacterium sp.]GJE08844.1 Blue-light-activated protein [Methylobacterium jeotgali]